MESWVGAMSTLLPRAIREGGHRFSFVTRDLQHYLRSAPASGPHPLLGADNVLTVETNDPEVLLVHLERLQPVLGFDGVATSCDYYLATAARLAERLGLPGPPAEAVEAACSKDRTRRVLGEVGVSGPAFVLAETLRGLEEGAAAMGYPLVVKPVDLCAGMFVRKVDDVGELRQAFEELQGFPVNARGQQRNPVVLLEELLTGAEVSVETVTFGGRTAVVGVTDKSVAGAPWFVETGHMFPAALEADTERAVTDTAVAAIKELGLDNTVCHTEIKLTADGPKLVEVNPRPAGNQITELIRRVTGIDLAAVHAQVALGEKPDLTQVDTGAASAAISFLLPPRTGEIEEISGIEVLRDPAVVDYRLKPSGHHAGAATSNNNYLGHVMVTSDQKGAARAHAESLIERLDVRYAEETG
ncbi:ATP-grasp domain-containing protein [Saccharopolyspora halophila]|uniref:ATP-grasp domain-containing protein n=1 Tax=Saccharopolyspora halophila TaxID=405551 RepID=UPI0031D42AF3